MNYIDAEVTGTEITHLKPRKHNLREYLGEIIALAILAAVVMFVLWLVWNFGPPTLNW